MTMAIRMQLPEGGSLLLYDPIVVRKSNQYLSYTFKRVIFSESCGPQGQFLSGVGKDFEAPS